MIKFLYFVIESQDCNSFVYLDISPTFITPIYSSDILTINSIFSFDNSKYFFQHSMMHALEFV